jgi:HD-GYP domain-containing protein (c-di-GMP phosphodiesterase class II)
MTGLNKARIANLLQISQELTHIKDIDAMLDKVLGEARRFTAADAGSIYLVHGDTLVFRYVQNDTLISDDAGHHYLYQNHEMPIDETSIAGYVARTQKILRIDNAYAIPATVPYRFNRSFDDSADYRTRAILTAPLTTSQGRVIGVLQLINPLAGDLTVGTFKRPDVALISHFANQAASAIERAAMTREIILRMIKMTELRDPKETGSHVHRVAAYSIEIYQKWAAARNLPRAEVKRFSDIFRIASMLHDVGKVAISDLVLKKTGPLSAQEFQLVKWHTVDGAQLFRGSTSDWDDMAAEIALNHHEKWDGTGYPGKIAGILDPALPHTHFGPGKRGEEIPFTARIVALADVYDALTSERSYKESWPEEKVLECIRRERGRHFDPEVVDAFLAIHDIILAIKAKYR